MVINAPFVTVIPLLCLVVVACALLGGWASRRGRRLVSTLLNLCSIAFLLLGIWLLLGLSYRHSRADMGRLERAPAITDRASEATRPERVRSARDEEAATEEAAAPPTAEQPEPRAEEPQPESGAESAGTEEAAEPEPPAADVIQDDVKLNPQAYIDFDARPDWVDRDDLDVGADHQISVCSGPFLRAQEARDELYKELKAATDRYINELVGNSLAASWLDYSEAEIRSRFVAPEHVFHERVVSPSFGVMHQSHALLVFGPEFRQEVETGWRELLAKGRLAGLAVAAAVVLGALGLLFGYLQLDTATRGFYTGRLRITTVVAILGLIVAGVWLARWIPWIWL